MGKTRTEVKQRWENKAYTKYTIRLRRDTDSHLIDYLDKHKTLEGTTNIFRNALEAYISERRKNMENTTHVCCICGKVFVGWGNNPYPVVKDEDARCCDDCNSEFVIPARIAELCGKDK